MTREGKGLRTRSWKQKFADIIGIRCIRMILVIGIFLLTWDGRATTAVQAVNADPIDPSRADDNVHVEIESYLVTFESAPSFHRQRWPADQLWQAVSQRQSRMKVVFQWYRRLEGVLMPEHVSFGIVCPYRHVIHTHVLVISTVLDIQRALKKQYDLDGLKKSSGY